MKKFKETGIMWEPELHFIPKKYFKMACKLGKFMRENGIREIQSVVESTHYGDMKYHYEKQLEATIDSEED